MFKGCFFKIGVIIIIILGIGFYAYTQYGDKIMAGVKKEVLVWMTSELDDKIAELNKEDAEKFTIELENYIEKLSKQDLSVAIAEVDGFIDHFENVLSNKQLNSEEIEKLKKLMRSDEKQK
jgi:C4-dicarboxylate transporter